MRRRTHPRRVFTSRTSRITATALVVAVSVVLLAGCIGDGSGTTTEPGAHEQASATAVPAKCPFKRDSISYWDLPDRMTRPQVKACQAHFAKRAPDGRFGPGTAAFTSQFCYAFDSTTREGECQYVRVAACRLAVNDGAFASLRTCFAASPGQRVVVHKKSPRVSVLASEPAVFEGPWLDVVDNTLDRWFRRGGGRVYFYEPRRKAWDSRTGRIVPFPDDLVDFVASNPYVRVERVGTARFGELTARQIDFVVRQGDPKARRESLCGEYTLRDDPCLPISADANEEGYVSFSLELHEPQRLIDLHTRSGRLILLVSGIDRFRQLTEAERLLRTLRVG